MPPERLMSFLRVRVCGWCGGPPGVGPACRVCRLVVVAGLWFAPGGRVCRGTFEDQGHTGKCSPQQDLHYGMLRTNQINTFIKFQTETSYLTCWVSPPPKPRTGFRPSEQFRGLPNNSFSGSVGIVCNCSELFVTLEFGSVGEGSFGGG